jgi:hypothetical protein
MRKDFGEPQVSVRDQSGALVHNLKQDDFTVLEDRKPQTITNFSTEPQPLSAAITIDTGMTGASLSHDLIYGARSHLMPRWEPPF